MAEWDGGEDVISESKSDGFDDACGGIDHGRRLQRNLGHPCGAGTLKQQGGSVVECRITSLRKFGRGESFINDISYAAHAGDMIQFGIGDIRGDRKNGASGMKDPEKCDVIFQYIRTP